MGAGAEKSLSEIGAIVDFSTQSGTPTMLIIEKRDRRRRPNGIERIGRSTRGRDGNPFQPIIKNLATLASWDPVFRYTLGSR